MLDEKNKMMLQQINQLNREISRLKTITRPSTPAITSIKSKPYHPIKEASSFAASMKKYGKVLTLTDGRKVQVTKQDIYWVSKEGEFFYIDDQGQIFSFINGEWRLMGVDVTPTHPFL
jgi:hypothetical protein